MGFIGVTQQRHSVSTLHRILRNRVGQCPYLAAVGKKAVPYMKVRITAVIALILLSHNASAQQERYSITELATLAVEYAPAVRLSQGSLEAQEVQSWQSKQARLPALNASVNSSRQYGLSFDQTAGRLVTDNSDFFSANASLSVSLFEFGAISNRIKQAEARVQSSAYDLERTRQDIVYQMAIAYLQTQLASDQLTIRAGALETERAIYASIEQAVSIGTRPPTDALQQQANVARAELTVIEQEQVLTRQLNILRRLTNIQDLGRASLQPIDLDPLLTRRVPEVRQLMGMATMARPERASIEAQQEAASFGLKIAEAGRLPSLSASTSYGTSFSSSALSPSIDPSTGEMSFAPIPFGSQLSDNRSQSVGLRLSIPIFNRGAVRSAVQQSTIGLEALALQEQDWMDRQQADLAEAKLAFESGVNRIRASRAQLEAAQASLAAILASYEQGVASLIDLTQAQFGSVQAEGELLFAKYQAVVSLIDLARLTGTISPDAPFFVTN